MQYRVKIDIEKEVIHICGLSRDLVEAEANVRDALYKVQQQQQLLKEANTLAKHVSYFYMDNTSTLIKV